ncbi:ribonuclease III [Phormidesmis priestleyi ULC007]|uniref:Ribonuclease 3 n=1 Tax=Phormidesmis priestleyi ULC007 TaxID=1920490 RepID=A0A2T1DIJ4_9CYAN|nr:ribonuclease III [Phormidesmis priestleyi]PSB20285.1 ribonuclease III [Phormidesmis priestleyi ULC007]PZO50154.1 MAG: ribonuclease III [Phormidesmis priestleyi]
MNLQYPRRQQQLRQLVQRLGLPETAPIKWELLDLALTHSTISAEENYEQLEFVGDAVVKLGAAEFLLEVYPHLKVGEFTALRSVLVSDRILATIANDYGFDRYLLVSASAMSDVAGQESRMADSLEAVLAALYLSTRTLELIRPWLDRHFQPLATEILADPARQNYKAALQTWTQAHQKTLPDYRTQENGQTHNDPDRFTAEVWIQGQCLAKGTGRSRKAAEQAAAQIAFLALSGQ